MYLFFDTETNGKIKDWNLPMKYVDNFPRIAQLGMSLYDENSNLIGSHSLMIKPDGWIIPKEKFFIDHNMSTERCLNEGIPIKDALNIFIDGIKNCEYLIAHNMDFDQRVVGAEMIRLGLKSGKEVKKICTMKSTTDFCKLQGFSKFQYKYPKLEELYKILFNKEISDAHDALGDVNTTAECFFELKRRNII